MKQSVKIQYLMKNHVFEKRKIVKKREPELVASYRKGEVMLHTKISHYPKLKKLFKNL